MSERDDPRIMSERDDPRVVLDALVIGGGPAGATVAALLAGWGHRVLAVHKAPSSRSLAESLPPSTKKLFALLGQQDAVEGAAFHPNRGNVSEWAGQTSDAATATSGYHVDRAAFDRVLLERARAAGVLLRRGVVRRVRGGAPLQVDCEMERRVVRYRARHVLDCSGRAGVVARHGLRRASPYRTTAIVAEWETPRWPAAERERTFIESYADAWAWSVPLSATRRQCTVMIDPAFSRRGKAGLQERYRLELAKARALATRLEGARQAAPAWTCDASVFDAIRAEDRGAFLVGDAASFIEPLSSAGVKKSLLSAWRAAVVVNTSLTDAAMASAAAALFSEREHQVFAECSRVAKAFFERAADACGHAFWTSRVAAIDGGSCMEANGAELSDREVAEDPGVLSVLNQLRTGVRLRLRPGAALRFEPVAVIEGRRVVMREAVVVPGVQQPVRFVGGANLPELVRAATCCTDVPGLLAAYDTRMGQGSGAIQVQGVLAGLSLLVSRQILIQDPAAEAAAMAIPT
jgi:flavin-dependent dehydrogenase